MSVMERVILRSTDDGVGRLVREFKKSFEEKYHSCEAFREELLSDYGDSQRVVQNIQDPRNLLIVILDRALHELLDHKKSRRLLNKIRDQFKCGRVVFLKYQVKDGDIMEFLEDITEEKTYDVCDLYEENVLHIAAKIWELPCVNRRATESEDTIASASASNAPSLDLAAKKLNSNEWNAMDKFSVCGEDYTRRTSDFSHDPQESHNSFSDSIKSVSSVGSSEGGSSLSSGMGDGTVILAQSSHTTENVQSVTEKFSSKLQVYLPDDDGRNATSMENNENARLSVPATGNSKSMQATSNGTGMSPTFSAKEKTVLHANNVSPGSQNSEIPNHSLPCHLRLQSRRRTQEETVHSVGSGNIAVSRESQKQWLGLSETGNCQNVSMAPAITGLQTEGRSCPVLCTPDIMTNQIAMQGTDHPQNLNCAQREPSINLPVPTQETCNIHPHSSPTGNLSVQPELIQRRQETNQSMQSFQTSYHPMYYSGIRCQKCNQVKDLVMLYSANRLNMTELASPTSIPQCFSFPNSSGPEAMFTFSLCIECSNSGELSTETPIRQNSFCPTNGSVHSSNLFPPNLQDSLLNGPSQIGHPVQQRHAVSNLEKGSSVTNPQAIPRYESSPCRLNQLPMHQQLHQMNINNNNFNQTPFRQEILNIDERMRLEPNLPRNIPVVPSTGMQHSNSDNTQIRPNTLSRAPLVIPGNLSTTANKGRHPGPLTQPFSPNLTQQKFTGSWPNLHSSHFQTYGGASSETSYKPYSRLHSDDCAAGASAASNDYDHLPLTSLSHIVIEYIQSQMDFSLSHRLNWEQLAHLHGWNFGMIQTIKQKWQKRVIESPFLELIQNSQDFQNYTYGHLKSDLERIPRKDILEKLREFEEKQELVV